jgi:hypothetical protein
MEHVEFVESGNSSKILIELMIQKGLAVETERDPITKKTLLHAAAERMHSPVVDSLLKVSSLIERL